MGKKNGWNISIGGKELLKCSSPANLVTDSRHMLFNFERLS